MTMAELIDKHAGYVGSEDAKSYRRFATELLEMLRRSGRFHSLKVHENREIVESIDKALEELKK